MSITTFDSTKTHLLEILKGIAEGRIQLPDFQRGWVWDDEHVKGLLASVSLAYPIGAVMLLEMGNSDIHFKPRLVEGVTLANLRQPDALILDGQQRLTSLFQSLYSLSVVQTRNDRGQQIKRWYYVDMNSALDPSVDREDAIRSLPEDRILRNFRGEVQEDYSTAQKEYVACLFPLSQIADYSEWRSGFNQFWNYDKDKIKLFDQFEKQLIKRIEQYQVPIISLDDSTPKDAVCQVFEKVNTGGVALTVFELLTATFAVDNFDLRSDWQHRLVSFKRYPVLKTIDSTIFLQAIALLATYYRSQGAVSCKRRDILALSLADYRAYADLATEGFERAAHLLRSQTIYSDKDLPYRTQLAPFAAIMVALGDQAEMVGVKVKILRWYWNGVLGQLYGSAVESRFAKDLPEVINWLNGGGEPSTVTDSNFAPDRLYTLRTRNSAAYKGVSALIMRDGGHDFMTGDSISDQLYFAESIDIHHIFPKEWSIKANFEPRYYDSIVNKTPLSYKTNRAIGGRAPSIYLQTVEKQAKIDSAHLDHILGTHLIDPLALRSDDFMGFFEKRRLAILRRIEEAMGKPILTEISPVEAIEIAQFTDEVDVES